VDALLRIDIETYMKKNNLKHIVIVLNESDKLGKLCFLTGGFLTDYTNHRVDRKKEIWGYIDFKDGQPIRVAWESLQM